MIFKRRKFVRTPRVIILFYYLQPALLFLSVNRGTKIARFFKKYKL